MFSPPLAGGSDEAYSRSNTYGEDESLNWNVTSWNFLQTEYLLLRDTYEEQALKSKISLQINDVRLFRIPCELKGQR
jgi:hypothetical protein